MRRIRWVCAVLGGVVMTADEDDILASLHVLFHTTPGERFLQPKYGLDINALLFEPMSATLRTFFTDRVSTAILIHEPRIKLINLEIQVLPGDGIDGLLRLAVEREKAGEQPKMGRHAAVVPIQQGRGGVAFREERRPVSRVSLGLTIKTQQLRQPSSLRQQVLAAALVNVNEVAAEFGRQALVLALPEPGNRVLDDVRFCHDRSSS